MAFYSDIIKKLYLYIDVVRYIYLRKTKQTLKKKKHNIKRLHYNADIWFICFKT